MKVLIVLNILFSTLISSSQTEFDCKDVTELFNGLIIDKTVNGIKDSLLVNTHIKENNSYSKKYNNLEIYYFGKFTDSLWYGIAVENMELRLMQNFKRKIVKGDTTTTIFNAFGYWFDYNISDDTKVKKKIQDIRLSITEQCGIQFERELKKQKLIKAEVLIESYYTLIKNGVMPMIEIKYEYSKDFKKGSVMIVYNF